jgi:hypothetical protein
MTEAATTKKADAQAPVTHAKVVTIVEDKIGRLKDRPTKAAMDKRFDEVVKELSGQGELAAELQGRLDDLASCVERLAEAADPQMVATIKENIELKIAQIEGSMGEGLRRIDVAEAAASRAVHHANYLERQLGVKPEDEALGRTAYMAPIRFANAQPRIRHGIEFAIGAGAWLLIARLLETRFALPTGWVAILLAGATGVALGETLIIGGQVLFSTIEAYRASRAPAQEGRTV